MTNVNFVGNRRRWFAISAVLIVLSLGEVFIVGLNFSIDFVGGTSFLVNEVEADDLTSQQLEDVVGDAGGEDVTVQLTEAQDGGNTGVIVETAAVPVGSDLENDIQQALIGVTGGSSVDVTTVGPSWGERISQQALRALLVFLVIVVIYISVRLEWKMAGAAIVALLHDALITVGVYSLFGFTISPSTIIALLTILGYSLYDSVVIFDRIEENSSQLGQVGRRSYGEMVNTSMNEVLWRSLNTSITSLLPVGALLFLGAQLLGADTLQDLALALFVGMALGSYSSIFIAGPLLAWWKEQEPEYADMAAKLEQRIAAGEAEAVAAEDVIDARAPITTEYVRGRGKRKRKKK
jgi:preprotein translocase subunit SecF